MTVEIVIFVALLILLSAGLIGVLFPILPGLPFMFVVAIIYAALEGFDRLGPVDLIVLGAITVVSLLVDYFAGFFGAKFFGASKIGALGGLIGSIIGLILLPPLGLFVGLIGGVIFAERMFSKSSLLKSTKAATGALLGAVSGIAINVVLAVTFITIFIYNYWR